VCGIAGGFGDINERVTLAALRHRGPDAEGVKLIAGVTLVHTRLAVIDLDSRSDQPFTYGHTTITYSGEMWNYEALRGALEHDGCSFGTSGDTEVMAALLDRRGEAGLADIQGMFAVAWVRDDEGGIIRLARDRHGETPLHLSLTIPRLFASEKKTLMAMGVPRGAVAWVPPGHVVELREDGSARPRAWYKMPLGRSDDDLDTASERVITLIAEGARERTVADAPVCALISGGIDSTLVALHAGVDVGYVAVRDPRSPDLRVARVVAEAYEMELREVVVPAPSAADAAGVVEAIEMPHKAQVEIGWACLHLAERIAADGYKVVLSGEGSDELWASYGMSYHGVKKDGWFEYRRKLFRAQHRKNFARCNKVFMAKGVECRLPFLNTGLVEYALSLPEASVRRGGRLKAVLEVASWGDVPEAVLTRGKLAFQDGMGIKEDFGRAVSNPAAFYRAEHNRIYGREDVR